MSFVVDTNVLLRSIEPLHPQHAIAVESISQLLSAGQAVYFTLQNIAEFWNVATRPVERNGLGFPPAIARDEVDKIESLLTLLPDTPAVYDIWRSLLVDRNVSGVQVHDARIVATMKTHGISNLLTFNTDDFKRYTEITVHHPQSLALQH